MDGVKGFAFTTGNGTPFHQQNVNHSRKRITAGINKKQRILAEKDKRKLKFVFEDFTSHCTRHTFATRGFESSMNPKTVQKILGHSSISMTMDLYTHVTGNKAIEEINLMKGVRLS